MSLMKFFSAISVATLALSSLPATAEDATGAGASFPAPLYAKWADAYNKATGAKINYQSVGSSAGLRQIRGKTVDFGASDAPLSDAEAAKDGLLQFPTVIGGVVPVINVKGVTPGQLKLTGAVLADIYLGKVNKWNDPAITALNPGLVLPDATIAVVQRADGSGTTAIFTNYLSKVNADWKAKVGEGAAVKWVTGTGGKGNEGVAAFVQRLPNAIGYVEFSYAKANKMSDVQLRNASGAFVAADDATFKAAAAGAQWEKTFSQSLTEQAGKDAWPITGTTFILIYKSQDKPEKAAAALKFFDWAFANGDKMAVDLEYVALPDAVKALVRKSWAEVKDGSGKTVALK
jgi:phosphate transport system substrate-binding protein